MVGGVLVSWKGIGTWQYSCNPLKRRCDVATALLCRTAVGPVLDRRYNVTLSELRYMLSHYLNRLSALAIQSPL